LQCVVENNNKKKLVTSIFRVTTWHHIVEVTYHQGYDVRTLNLLSIQNRVYVFLEFLTTFLNTPLWLGTISILVMCALG
jgi:hypothetical protein